MSQKFNPLSGNFDLVLDKASEISVDDSSFVELTGTDVQTVLDSVDDVIAALPDPIYYAGTWNATTNTPTLANTDVGVTGALYQVNVAGTVDFGAGSISFDIGDRVVNNGTEWQKWDMTDSVTSVNGATGVVVLDTDDVAEGGSNLYFTDARAQGAITGGASSIVTANLTSNRALASDASGKVAASAVTDTELGYVSGVTSAIQTQLSGKATTELDNLGTTAINASLTPDSNGDYNIGQDGAAWDIGYFNRLTHQDATGNINLTNSTTFDSTSNASLDWESRQLLSDATVKLDWSGTDLDVNTRKITSVVDPTAAQDAATKNYVDTEVAAAVALTPHITTYTSSSGTFTPNVSTVWMRVRMVGAGGGGGGGNTDGGAGGTGGDTSFGSLVAAGGGGGAAATGAGGTRGGNTFSGDGFSQNGNDGHSAPFNAIAGGNGGAGPFGGAGFGSVSGVGGRAGEANTGSGGGGASSGSGPSGGGGASGGYIEAYITTISPSYSYSIGGGGAAGTAGSGAGGSAAGGSGIIIIEEYY